MAYDIIIASILSTAAVTAGQIKFVSVVKADTKNSNIKMRKKIM